MTNGEVVGSSAQKQSGLTIKGVSPRGVPCEATVTHVRKTRVVYVRVRVVSGEAGTYTWEQDIELKRGDASFNFAKLHDAAERFFHGAKHEGHDEMFLRAVWQRSAGDRMKAMTDVFPPKNVEKVEKEPPPDLFS